MNATDKQIAAINFLVEDISSSYCKKILPDFKEHLYLPEVEETIHSAEIAKKELEAMPARERREILYRCFEACNYHSNNYLLHHALLPVIVRTRALQGESDRLLANRLLKVEDMFFAQELLSSIVTDSIDEDNPGLYLIIGEEYESLMDNNGEIDSSRILKYPYIHFEASLESGELTITLSYKALIFLLKGLKPFTIMDILNSLRLSLKDLGLFHHYKVAFSNVYDPMEDDTLLVAYYTKV